MSAIDHGWNPPGKHPSKKVAHDFHEADKQVGKWEHATGGPVSPLSSVIGHGGGFGNPMGVQHLGGNSAFGGMMHFHAPRIPIQDTMRNIDQKIGGAAIKLPHLGQSLAGHGMPKQKLAGGGGVVDAGRRTLLKLLAASAAAAPAAKLATHTMQEAAPVAQKAASPLTQATSMIPKMHPNDIADIAPTVKSTISRTEEALGFSPHQRLQDELPSWNPKLTGKAQNFLSAVEEKANQLGVHPDDLYQQHFDANGPTVVNKLLKQHDKTGGLSDWLSERLEEDLGSED